MAYPTMEEALNGEGTENGNSADNSTNINNNGTVDATSAEASDNTGYAAENTEEAQAEVSEEDKYWKNVNENNTDFSSWTYLIQLIEKHGDIEKIRKAYDGFLAHFPLCYVYWKKYADHEANKGDVEKALEVYERGVRGIAHSVDLWMYYCSFINEKSQDQDHIRNLWERGATAIGTDFAAHTFWDKYIEYEISQGEFPRATAIYHRILQIPLDQLPQYHEKYKTYAYSRPVAELLFTNEAKELEEIKQQQEIKYKELTGKKEEGESIDPSEISAAGIKTGDELEVDFRVRIMASREEMYKKTLEEVTKRRTYEFGVQKRPYFHVKPLDETMLSNWRKYLDWEEKESTTADPARVIKLYERCLIAACYYSEFWLRYTKWLETNRSVPDARSVFVRATSIFLVKRPDIHLEYALFEEMHSGEQAARQIYENLASTLPGHVELTLRYVSFERRHGHSNSACAIFDGALSISSQDSKSGPFLSMHYARFLEKVMNAPSRAREVYEKALHKFPEHKGLWMACIQFEIGQQGTEMESKVLALYVRSVAEDSKLTSDEKHDMWQNYVEFAADWTSTVATLRKLQDQFRALYPTSSFRSETTKKRTFDALHSHDAQPSKVARTTPAQAPATTAAATAYAQAQAAQAAQAQAQAQAQAAAAAQAAQAAQYPYPYAQYAGYQGYPGYTYPYAASAAPAQYGYGYTYPYPGYTQPT